MDWAHAYFRTPFIHAGRMEQGGAGGEGTLEVSCYPCYQGFLIRSFADGGTEDVFNGRRTKAARRACPPDLWQGAVRKLEQLDSAELLEDLRVPPGNRLESLSGDRKGEYSIRINDRYRVCFRWSPAGPSEVRIVDYH
jgi:proteic killer suppression protein